MAWLFSPTARTTKVSKKLISMGYEETNDIEKKFYRQKVSSVLSDDYY
jgi:hypothetical protein